MGSGVELSGSVLRLVDDNADGRVMQTEEVAYVLGGVAVLKVGACDAGVRLVPALLPDFSVFATDRCSTRRSVLGCWRGA